jgi:cation diffusion facilitator CzcD-associated flavoprotein CzcO
MAEPHSSLDVLIVGGGISGVSMAWHLAKRLPHKRFAVLERRANLGGTWDLFRYPGIRSDSDMYTLGFSFRPWTARKAIAAGPDILAYVNETADTGGLRQHVRFNTEMVRADFDSARAVWRVEARHTETGETQIIEARFLATCSGYYAYDAGYLPEFAGLSSYRGLHIHPQHWPDGADLTGKRVVVVGSGATAVTLVPALAETAAHVTMLQRSPTYMASRPSEDGFARLLQRVLPAGVAYGVTRWKNILEQQFVFFMARKRPKQVAERIMTLAKAELPKDFDAETHLKPNYNPWDQRLCLVPDNDLFRAISSGKADIVTDTIATFTPTGLRLASGRELDADVVVTATGLKLQLFGGAEVAVDGKLIHAPDLRVYKGMMWSGVPNLSVTFGYTNASWTLKADLTSAYVCRLLKHMDRTGARIATPTPQGAVGDAPFVDFSSGYFQRAAAILPRQGDRAPWRLHQNYFRDLMNLRYGPVEDGVMQLR